MATVKEHLIAARALIAEPSRWTKGKYRHDGKRCTLIAIDHAGGGYAEHMALRTALPAGFEFLAEFNDNPETNHADVIALFDRAIQAQEDSHAG